LPALETHGPEQSGYSQEVIGVEMGDEDGLDTETGPEPHHLPLGPFPAVE
jgi:hypothetical protein